VTRATLERSGSFLALFIFVVIINDLPFLPPPSIACAYLVCSQLPADMSVAHLCAIFFCCCTEIERGNPRAFFILGLLFN